MRRILIGCVALVPALSGGQDEPAWPVLQPASGEAPLAGTAVLKQEGDLSMRMIAGIDRFLDAEIAAVMKERSGEGGTREGLARKLGLPRDTRPSNNAFLYVSTRLGPLATARGFTVRDVRWTAFGEVEAAGLLLEPSRERPVADVIALPDAGQAPEELAGLPPFEESETPSFAARLAVSGCRVLIPVLINRSEAHGMPMREWLHRPAWELGRTLAGYEVQKILAAVDCFKSAAPSATGKVAVAGWGEGGRLALYAAALDERIDGAVVSCYFGPRGRVWDELADRTVFGLLHGHTDAEVAALVSPRHLIIEHGSYPEAGFRLDEDGDPQRFNRGAGKGGKPGKLLAFSEDEVRAEFERIPERGETCHLRSSETPVSEETLLPLLRGLGIETSSQDRAEGDSGLVAHPPHRTKQDVDRRHADQVAAIERHNQWALTDSERVRTELFHNVKLGSVSEFAESTAQLREKFSKDVIGEIASLQSLPDPGARTRPFQEGPHTVSYEVVLDVHEGVYAYGILTLPKGLIRDGSERRPVVVCQHGLEGRPQDTVGEPSYHYYKAFATRLAERGFITFAPQNIYIGHDLFRILQFKANALGATLFSIMVPQHRQITNWLASLSFVDPERIGFYGLSYGGKSAMRIPPLVDRYCLSICSADFNEWIWKNAATDPLSLRYSYANMGEYEIFEFDLGNTFNYYEMATLICPRPFMVERGHFDGVAPDKTVAYEFAKVRHLYAAKLGIADRAEIEWFVGPHTINGAGTYDFLHRHLNWPSPSEE